MKKLIPILILTILIIPAVIVSAEGVTITNPIKAESFEEIINNVIGFIFTISLALGPLMVVIGAFMIMSAGDDMEKVKKGRQIIFYTVIGLLIVLFAKGLISMVKQVMGLKL